MYSFDEVKNYDLELANAMEDELARQRDHIELIASENFVSKAVMAAMGSPLTNKYAEGYPGKRYYGGCEYVDVVETLAIERAKKLFGCDYANVQPHSGAQANLAAFFAMVEPGDTVMGMNLAHGGHLTHGSPVNISLATKFTLSISFCIILVLGITATSKNTITNTTAPIPNPNTQDIFPAILYTFIKAPIPIIGANTTLLKIIDNTF